MKAGAEPCVPESCVAEREASVRRRLFVASILAGVAANPALAQTPRPAATPAPVPAANLIDLNSASRDDLMALEGIGEVRAEAIIRARPFKTKTELVERRLIPEALYDKISDKVVARTATTPAPAPAGRTPTPAPTQQKRG